jgi:hypothetical protein
MTAAQRQQNPVAGDLLGVVALDRSGLFVTSEGAFVRIIEVTPLNPRVMGDDLQVAVSEAFAAMCGRLRPGQSLQFYVESVPERLEDVLRVTREEVDRQVARQPEGRREALRGLAGAHEQSLVTHASEQAAVRFAAYVVVPFVPERVAAKVNWEQLRPSKKRTLPTAPLTRGLADHNRVVRESLVHTDNVTADLEALDLKARLLTGTEVNELLFHRFNPSSVTAGRIPRLEIVGGLDELADARSAAEAAYRLRTSIAASPIDFDDPRCVGVETSLERVHTLTSLPDYTTFGCLLGAMEIDRPFALSVFVHARDRQKERKAVRTRFKRLHGLNAGAEMRGRTPNLDQQEQEQEAVEVLDELRSRQGSGLFDVAVYQSVREPGPDPSKDELIAASERAIKAIQDATDAQARTVGWRQKDLWLATLPLGRDVAGDARLYISANVGDLVPLVGPSCGSPEGLPMFFAAGVRTVLRFNPWDPTFNNGICSINGLQGTGKTAVTIALAAALLPHDVMVRVLDRSTHWEFLTQLVPDAAYLSIGSARSAATLNPWDVPDLYRIDPEKVRFIKDLHAVLIGENGRLTKDEEGLMSEAINGVYALCACETRQPLERDLQTELRRLEQEDRSAAGGTTQRAAILDSLARRLAQYVFDGEDAFLMDRLTSVPTDSPLVVFDTRAASTLLVPSVMIVMEHTVAQVERRRLERLSRGGPPPLFPGDMFASDETWKATQHPVAGEYMNEIGRRSRHLGLFLAAVSQHLQDYDTPHGRAFLRSATMRVFFQQSEDELRFVQESVGLADNAVKLIKRLRTAKGRYARAYLMNGPRGEGEVSVLFGRMMYWLTTSEPTRDVPLRNSVLARQMEAHGGDQHAAAWATLKELAAMEETR